MAATVQVTFDCADPARLAEFWAAVLGYKVQDPPEGFASWEEFLSAQGVPQEMWNSASAVVDPEARLDVGVRNRNGGGPRIFFQRVPEPKTVKNRVHLDVTVSGGPATPLEQRRKQVDAEVERVTGLGATRVRQVEERGEYWVVMQDPEGNEFCLG